MGKNSPDQCRSIFRRHRKEAWRSGGIQTEEVFSVGHWDLMRFNALQFMQMVFSSLYSRCGNRRRSHRLKDLKKGVDCVGCVLGLKLHMDLQGLGDLDLCALFRVHPKFHEAMLVGVGGSGWVLGDFFWVARQAEMISHRKAVWLLNDFEEQI